MVLFFCSFRICVSRRQCYRKLHPFTHQEWSEQTGRCIIIPRMAVVVVFSTRKAVRPCRLWGVTGTRVPAPSSHIVWHVRKRCQELESRAVTVNYRLHLPDHPWKNNIANKILLFQAYCICDLPLIRLHMTKMMYSLLEDMSTWLENASFLSADTCLGAIKQPCYRLLECWCSVSCFLAFLYNFVYRSH